MSGSRGIDALSFAVIVVNYGSSALLERNLASLALPPTGRVVVVDCFSDSAERARIGELAARQRWEAILLDQNAGFGGGTNAGATRALALGARVLVALNPDAQIDSASLVALVTAVKNDPMLFASPTITDRAGHPWFSGADLYLDDGAVHGARARDRFSGRPRRPWATGACFAISAELWSVLGGFDEEYFLYWEDIDLSHRAIDAGARLEPVDATVVHDVGGTHVEKRPPRGKSELYYYFNIRNRMLYAVKHLEADAVTQWLRASPRVALEVLLRGGRRQLVTSLRPWRAYVRGLRDGNRIVRDHRQLAKRQVRQEMRGVED